jgi:hypothetical protein
MKTNGLLLANSRDNDIRNSISSQKEYALVKTKSDLLQIHSNTTMCVNRLESRSFLLQNLHKLMKSFLVQVFLFLIVLLSILLLCVETYAQLRKTYQTTITILDILCLMVFLIECAYKIAILRLHYFHDCWNLIDFVTIMASLIDLMSKTLTITYEKNETLNIFNDKSNNSSKYGNSLEKLSVISMVKHFKVFRILRAFKSLRVLRTIKLLSSLEIILETCLNSIQSLRAIFLLMSIFLYNFSVVGTSLFRDFDSKRFGSLVNSTFTLFQVITLDDWYSIYKSNTTTSNEDYFEENFLGFFTKHYFLISFLIGFLVLENFIMLNLFVAVLVDNFHQAREARDAVKSKKPFRTIDSKTVANKVVQRIKTAEFSAGFRNWFSKFQNNEHSIRHCVKKPFFKLRKRLNLNKIYFCKVQNNRSNRNRNNNNNENESDSSFSEFDQLVNLCNKRNETNDYEDSDSNTSEIFLNSFQTQLLPSKETILINRHFQLLASIEYYSHQMSQVYGILENLVKITDYNNHITSNHET